MYVTQQEYTKLGYTAVPEVEFDRYEAMAETTVRKYTVNRISDDDLRPDNSDAEVQRVAEMNQRGVCEIMDMYYIGNNPNSDVAKAREIVTSFSNSKYSETYLGNARSDSESAAPDRMSIDDILTSCFTRDQMWRNPI